MDAYGVRWDADPLVVELKFCRNGGYLTVQGKKVGLGYQHHFKEVLKLIAPWFMWFQWPDMILDAWCKYQSIGIMGPAASGKTTTAALIAYGEFCVHPKGTSILMSSTDIPGLKRRVYGEVVKCVSEAKMRYSWLPGYPVDSLHTIFAKEPTDEELRVPKDAIMGVACKKGGQYVGLGAYCGIHNTRVFLFADEGHLMPRAFYDSASNMRANQMFKMMVMGNPIGDGDALDIVCEPHKSLGGWEGLDESKKSRTWKTRGSSGISVQLSGLDSPNFNYERGLNPFRGIITPEQIADIQETYGEDSWQYRSQALGIRPKGAGNRRVITHPLCDKGNAFGEPIWDGGPTMDYVGLDAAYSGTGGDRTPLIRIRTGKDIHGKAIIAIVDGPHIIPVDTSRNGEDGKPIIPESQITTYAKNYCETHRLPASRFGFDSTGRGSLVATMAREWATEFQAVEFGGQPPEGRKARADRPEMERDIYGKMVTCLWFAVRNAIDCGQLRGLPMSVFEEGSYREWGIKNAKEDVEPKDDLRKRLGRSCDLFDALVVAVELARRDGFEIGGTSSTRRDRNENMWLRKADTDFRKLLGKEVLA